MCASQKTASRPPRSPWQAPLPAPRTDGCLRAPLLPAGPPVAAPVRGVAQQAGGGFGGLVLGGGQDVGVQVGGDGDAGVAELVLHGFEVGAGGVGEGAAPWRRSCSRIGGSPARVMRIRKRWVR